jgi:hypothetical protein
MAEDADVDVDEQPPSDEAAATDTEEAPPSYLADVAKLWWVNVREQQLSDIYDIEEEEESLEEATESSADLDELETEMTEEEDEALEEAEKAKIVEEAEKEKILEEPVVPESADAKDEEGKAEETTDSDLPEILPPSEGTEEEVAVIASSLSQGKEDIANSFVSSGLVRVFRLSVPHIVSVTNGNLTLLVLASLYCSLLLHNSGFQSITCSHWVSHTIIPR